MATKKEPKRIQLKRSVGWKRPTNTVYVGRPTKWGNPFRVGVHGTLEECLDGYRKWLKDVLEWRPDFLDELKGKDLACWCPLDKPCHVDVLLACLKEGES